MCGYAFYNMGDTHWRSVGVKDYNRTEPLVIQQKVRVIKDMTVPLDEHRSVPLSELE